MIKQISYRLILMALLGGCAAADVGTHAEPEVPHEWSHLIPTEPSACADLSGIYVNRGMGHISGKVNLQKVRLDAALGFPLPFERMPRSVLIVDSREKESIRVNFIGEKVQSIHLDAKCIDGWLYNQSERNDAYLGDSVQMDSAQRSVSMLRASDGSLIVHQRTEETYRVGFIFRSRTSKEAWLRFLEAGK
jgi:hypothetical protein